LSYSHTSPRHSFESGVLYDATSVTKIYGLLLQPDNYLAPGSLFPTAIVDTAPNTAHSIGAYLQDGWQLSTTNRVDAGVRYDTFTIFSTTFRNGFSQVSPRLRFTHVVNDRTSWYAYYGRLFTPFSFENVSPRVAQLINPASGLAFDLQPARESLYEIGGAFGVGGNARGSWKIAHKSLVNVIDDAQVGTTNIHQDINFGDGRADFQDVLLEFPRGNGTHDYVSLTHSRAVNRGCGSQLLSGCPPPPYDWFDADHDQRWDASAGKELTLARGGWLALTAEFGSGLSTGAACDRCKVPPHLTFDASFGHPLSSRTDLIVNVHNLLDDRYALTINSALQGTHYARPFSFDVGVRMRY
ncbi:MAG: TonB-dependent receptor, partial [Candidatus Eremiobacteraeota bacterium]|nr:TonB-dependent receptor [Candidatus Eremiobacteraeota bacterium]